MFDMQTHHVDATGEYSTRNPLLSELVAEEELDAGIEFLEAQVELLRTENRELSNLALPIGATVDFDPFQGSALTDLCLALFNLNEMIYLD